MESIHCMKINIILSILLSMQEGRHMNIKINTRMWFKTFGEKL